MSACRIAVLGPAGPGKSFLAARLAQATGLPLVHLDRLGYRPGWRETPGRSSGGCTVSS